MTRTCDDLGVCQSRYCDDCPNNPYPFYPGGQPVWRWGSDWRKRANPPADEKTATENERMVA